MKTKLPKYPRFINRWYAFIFGYFWLPCPHCGRMFGGHEWAGTLWRDSTNSGWGTCRFCNFDNSNEYRGLL